MNKRVEQLLIFLGSVLWVIASEVAKSEENSRIYMITAFGWLVLGCIRPILSLKGDN